MNSLPLVVNTFPPDFLHNTSGPSRAIIVHIDAATCGHARTGCIRAGLWTHAGVHLGTGSAVEHQYYLQVAHAVPVVHIRRDIALLRSCGGSCQEKGISFADGALAAMPMPVITYMGSTIDAVKCKSRTRPLHIYPQLPISTENVLRLEGGSCVLGLQALAHPDATQLAFAIAVDAFVLARSASCPEHVKAWRALCACHYACDCILSRHRRLCPHIVMPYRLAMQHQPCPARIYPAMAWCIV